MKDTKALLEHAQLRRGWCAKDLARHDEDIARFEKELAEAEKPKLRHGDYGEYADGGYWLILSRNGHLEVFGASEGSGMLAKKLPEGIIVLGNIFDDLTALSKNMTEFDRSDLRGGPGVFNKFGFRINGSCIDYHGDSYVSLNLEEFSKAIRNLQIMEATMNREKAQNG